MTIFINKGDKPLGYHQAVKRGLRYFEQEKAYWQREQGLLESDPTYLSWANQWTGDNKINAANNIFNHQLDVYKKSVDRLKQYILSEGRAEITEQTATGLFDEDGNEIIDTVVVLSAIEPLPAMIEQVVYDEIGNATTEAIKNPAITIDEEERAEAQKVIDYTSQEVKDFAGL